ncbi:hypothetical protein ScPMuIL_016755 [Solemya velum]
MAQPVTSQPMGTPLLIGTVQGHRDWTTGLFGCFSDCGSCLCTWCCLPCMLCTLSTRLGDCMCMPYCVPGSSIAMRTRVRTLGGIQGSVCSDCVATTICGACVICQMSREMDAMGL